MPHQAGQPGCRRRQGEDDRGGHPAEDHPPEQGHECHEHDLRHEELAQLSLGEQRYDDLRLEGVRERAAEQFRDGERHLREKGDEPRQRSKRRNPHQALVHPRQQQAADDHEAKHYRGGDVAHPPIEWERPQRLPGDDRQPLDGRLRQRTERREDEQEDRDAG